MVKSSAQFNVQQPITAPPPPAPLPEPIPEPTPTPVPTPTLTHLFGDVEISFASKKLAGGSIEGRVNLDVAIRYAVTRFEVLPLTVVMTAVLLDSTRPPIVKDPRTFTVLDNKANWAWDNLVPRIRDFKFSVYDANNLLLGEETIPIDLTTL